MSAANFNPRERVAAMGTRALSAVYAAADGKPWTFATLYAAAQALLPTKPRLARRLHQLGAEWAINYRETRA